MPEHTSEPVRVCLLVDGDSLMEWQHAALQRMVADTSAEITVVVSNREDRSQSTREFLERAVELREWTLVWAVRSLLGEEAPLRGTVDLADCEYTDGARRYDCVPEQVDGWKNEIPSDVVEQVADEADFAVRFGFGFLVGDILTDLEHGVVSFHHGDFREYRGQPAGAWEMIHGRDEAGVTLQRINDELDAGEVVAMKRVPIDDADTLAAVRGRLYRSSEDMLATAVSKIERGETEFQQVEDLGTLYSFPEGKPALTFLAKELWGYAK